MAGCLLFAMALGPKRSRPKRYGESLCVDLSCFSFYNKLVFLAEPTSQHGAEEWHVTESCKRSIFQICCITRPHILVYCVVHLQNIRHPKLEMFRCSF